jgi:hypothetical protein
LKGAAILVTLGVLFLLHEYQLYDFFDQTWPVLLIVIGLLSFASHKASTEGHTQGGIGGQDSTQGQAGWQTGGGSGQTGPGTEVKP